MRRTLSLRRLFSDESAAPRCSVKKKFLKISQNSEENTCARVSFLITLQASLIRASRQINTLKKNTLEKETLALVFSCEFYKNFKNTFYIEHLQWLLLVVSNTGIHVHTT